MMILYIIDYSNKKGEYNSNYIVSFLYLVSCEAFLYDDNFLKLYKWKINKLNDFEQDKPRKLGVGETNLISKIYLGKN